MARETSSSPEHVETTGVLDRVADESRLLALSESLTTQGDRLVRNSALYRWFTAEPDPPIAIDLRETATVGPFVKLVEKLVPHLHRAWRHSTAVAAVRAFPGTDWVIGLFEPPERSEQTTNGDKG